MLENIPWGLVLMQAACAGCFGLGYLVKSKGVTGIVADIQNDIAIVKTDIANLKTQVSNVTAPVKTA